MRKIFIWVIIMGLLLPIFPVITADAASSIKISYNGNSYNYSNKQVKIVVDEKRVDLNNTPGIIINGIALVSFKDVFKRSSIKAACSYNKSNNKIVIKKGSIEIKMTLNSKTAYVNGKKINMSVAPRKVKYKGAGKTRVLVPARFVAENLGYKYTWNSVSSTSSMSKVLNIKYGGNSYVYTGTQGKVVVNGQAIKVKGMPVIVNNNTALVQAKKVFKNSTIGAEYNYNKKAKTLSLSKGSNNIVLTMGSKIASVNGERRTMDTAPQVITNKANGNNYVMVPGKFVTTSLGYVYNWDNNTLTSVITEKSVIIQDISKDNNNVEDTNIDDNSGQTNEENGNVQDDNNTQVTELKAVWISYLEFGYLAKTKEEFTRLIDNMFDGCVNLGMNAVIVQVRPFSDAMYNSSYFPWSKYVSGTQGSNPGYDPLEYMVNAAHERGLEIHAWLNPYRVTSALSDTGLTEKQMITKHLSNLSKDNPAKKWLQSSNTKDNRNVLLYEKALYYNPASLVSQELIINGIKEIVGNYDVDGIHFDDYFYPSLGTNASTVFDKSEYDTYVAESKANGKSAKSIANWRRDNVSNLIKNTYTAIKKINPSVQFGISPAGNISNLRSDTSYFVDIDKWLSSTGYIDYVCPQIYWGFNHKTVPYGKVTNEWVELKKKGNVNLYIGIPVYKAGSGTDVQNGVSEWTKNNDVLARQVQYGRDTGYVDGFMFYRFDSFYENASKTEITNLLKKLFY